MTQDSNVTDNRMIEIAESMASIDASLKRIADALDWLRAKAEELEAEEHRVSADRR